MPTDRKPSEQQQLRPIISMLVVYAMLLLLQLCAADQEIMVTNGFLHNNQDYKEKTTLNLKGLDNVREVTSVATVSNGKVNAELRISGMDNNAPETFATGLYMTVSNAHITGENYFWIEFLPPNAYIHFYQTTCTKHYMRVMAIQTGWEYNTTVFIEESDFVHTSSIHALRIFKPPAPAAHEFRDNCVLHVKGMTVYSDHGVFAVADSPLVLHHQSALVFEGVKCMRCSDSVFSLNECQLNDHSAFIARHVWNQHEVNSIVVPFLKANTITVDATSVLSFTDIDTANDFKSTKSNAIEVNRIDGAGTIVFGRWLMQRSGLRSRQPVHNARFWVSARTTATTDLTPQQLRDSHNFNVNRENTFKWDGTGEDGACVSVGGGIPDRATYKLVNGKCVATCDPGYVPPACTAPATSQCLVDNCDLCYRITKTKCFVCAPHTTHENDDTVCRCPISGCLVCPSATECTQCQEGYNVSAGGDACIRCSIDVAKCVHCSTASKCDECEPYYNVSADKNTCFDCRIDNCLSCSADKVCAKCAPQYSLTKPGVPNNSCIPCKLDHCVLCGSDNNCQQCADGSTKPAGGTGDCVPCNVKHCERCDTANECTQCIDKHTLVGVTECYPCAVPGCVACDSDELCKECADNYTLYDKKCIECAVEHCKDCRENGMCSVCAGSLVPALSGTECISCNVTNCTICSSSDVCSMCQCGMVPTEDGDECVPCIASNCKYCKLYEDGKKCAVCNGGYELRDDRCVKVLMPSWAVFLIVVAGTIIIALIAALCVWYYLRYQAEMRQNAVNAEDRRRSRQSNHAAARNYDIIVLDLGDIEAAASGVADNQKTIAL